MTISKDLFLAIPSMDAYNQGYNKGIDHGKTQVGSATKKTDSTLVFTDPDDTPPDEAASFYAVEYDVDATKVEGFTQGTVISYRGTDQPFSEFLFTDFPLSTLGQWRDPQIAFAQQFYKSVDDATTNTLHLTGHSLGGALAGITASVGWASAHAF